MNTDRKKLIYRHGDVLLLEVGNVPEKTKELHHRILAEGEATGHMHRIKDPTTAILYEETQSKDLYLRTVAEALLTHQEHATIIIPAGKIFRVVHQREYTPEKIVRVAD